LIFDLVEQKRDELGGSVEAAGSIGLAVVAAPGTAIIMHSLEVLGDLVGVHAVPTDSILVGECLSEDCVWTDGILSWYEDLVVGVTVTSL
jgi:hypothetical protein